jgi:poly(A) polymerase Pap1
VGQVRALAAGAVYFGGAKWKRLLSKICELYCMAQSCFTRNI